MQQLALRLAPIRLTLSVGRMTHTHEDRQALLYELEEEALSQNTLTTVYRVGGSS
jgi:hypothetical protein